MNVIVIGAGYAGLLAALRIAGKTRKTGTHITLINATDTFVERIRLHQLASGEPLPTHSIPALLRGTGINFVRGRVTEIHPAAHEVIVTADAGSTTLPYHHLIYALGSTSDTCDIPGGREHALTLDSPASAQRIDARLRANPTAQIVVIGGGLTGIELTMEIGERYPRARLTLLTSEALGLWLSKKGHAYLLDVMARRNITVREQTTAVQITGDAVVTADGQRYASDLSLWAGSMRVPALAREAGFAINACGQILVDPQLRSVSHPDVFAAGDAAASGLRMACATAMPLGAHAADNVASALRGDRLQPFRFGFFVRCISLGRHGGLVQVVNADDSPREQIFTGRFAALMKEFICRYTVWSLYTERRLPGFFRWGQSLPVEPRGEAPAAHPVQQGAV